MIEVVLENDELKIDGNLAVCWSSNLDFTVERTTKTLVGSAVSGEGLVNVYRGTGRVLMCPVAPTSSLFEAANTMSDKGSSQEQQHIWQISRQCAFAGRRLPMISRRWEKLHMPKGTNQKFKLYRLAQIMMKKTDEEHYITMPEIKEALAEYDITADRKSSL